MRLLITIGLSVLALVATGCGGERRELKAAMTNATPAGSQSTGECSGLGRFIESAWSKCIVVVHGTRREVIADVAKRLRGRGFTVGCEDSLGELQLVGVRDQIRIIASARPGAITFDASDGNRPLDVVDARFAPPGSRSIPAGSVGLKLTADKLEGSSASHLVPQGSCP